MQRDFTTVGKKFLDFRFSILSKHKLNNAFSVTSVTLYGGGLRLAFKIPYILLQSLNLHLRTYKAPFSSPRPGLLSSEFFDVDKNVT